MSYIDQVKNKLKEHLDTAELAKFEYNDYLELISADSTYHDGTGNCYYGRASIGTYQGKENVLKLSQDPNHANSHTVMVLALPKVPNKSTITIQVWIDRPSGVTSNHRFGLFGQNGGGWMNATPTDNHSTTYPIAQWTNLVWHEINTNGQNNILRFCFESAIQNIYISGIWDGDVREQLENLPTVEPEYATAGVQYNIKNDSFVEVTGYTGEDENVIIARTFYGYVVNSIADNAFLNTAIKSISIPDTITSIGNNAFCQCANLTQITLPNSLTEISVAAFMGCSALTSIELPSNIITIKQQAFEQCLNLTSIVIPDSVESIDLAAFNGCLNLKRVIFGKSLTTIGAQSFATTGLTELFIPNTVTTINQKAFSNCESLKHIIVGSTVETMTEAFVDCQNLSTITLLSSTPPTGLDSSCNNSNTYHYCSSIGYDAYKTHLGNKKLQKDDLRIYFAMNAVAGKYEFMSQSVFDSMLAHLVKDIKINGVSITADGKTEIPIASNVKHGVVQISHGLRSNNNKLETDPAGEGDLVNKIDMHKPITSAMLNKAIREGLLNNELLDKDAYQVEEGALDKTKAWLGIPSYRHRFVLTLSDGTNTIKMHVNEVNTRSTPYAASQYVASLRNLTTDYDILAFPTFTTGGVPIYKLINGSVAFQAYIAGQEASIDIIKSTVLMKSKISNYILTQL